MRFSIALFIALLTAVVPTVACWADVTASDKPGDKPSDHPRVILALGGGGTRGAAHIGVLRVLQREHIPIDGIAGTSMGAVIGGLFCAGVSPNEIASQMLDKKMLHAYDTVPIPIRVAAIPICFIPHLLGYRPYDGLYKGRRFRTYVDAMVPPNYVRIEHLPIPFAAVCSNLLDGRATAIVHGNLGKAIQASCAIPFLRRPVYYDENRLCVDGGLESNLPVPEARKLGADIVIAVDVDENVHSPHSATAYRHILSVPHRVISMILARIDENAVTQADVLIHPEVDGIGLLSEKPYDGARAILAGERAAEAALPAIRARLSKQNTVVGTSVKSN